MKFKFPNLLNPLGNIILKKYWSFYSSELIYLAHFNMRHPVAEFFNQLMMLVFIQFMQFFGWMASCNELKWQKGIKIPSWPVGIEQKLFVQWYQIQAKYCSALKGFESFLAMVGLYLILLNKQFGFNDFNLFTYLCETSQLGIFIRFLYFMVQSKLGY